MTEYHGMFMPRGITPEQARAILGWPCTLLDPKSPNGHATKDGRKARYLGTVQSADGCARHIFAITEPAGHDTVQKVLVDGRVSDVCANQNDIHDVPATQPLQVDDFWMVLADGQTYTKFRHTTYDSAITEAKRLAASNPTTKFFVLGCFGAALDKQYVETHIDGIPF